MDEKDFIILKCKRCGYVWHPRNKTIPIRCPDCRTPYWNREKIKKE